MTTPTQQFCKCGAHKTVHRNGVGSCTEQHCQCEVFRPQAANEQEVVKLATELQVSDVINYPRPELYQQVWTAEWLSLPKDQVPELIREYIGFIETAETDKVCRCSWRYHPEDEGKEYGKCRECGEVKEHIVHLEDTEVIDHSYRGVRRVKTDEDPNCFIHTKEGLIRGFFEWAFKGLEGA